MVRRALVVAVPWDGIEAGKRSKHNHGVSTRHVVSVRIALAINDQSDPEPDRSLCQRRTLWPSSSPKRPADCPCDKAVPSLPSSSMDPR